MPRFNYRFEKILSYRRHQEKQKQRELAAIRKKEQGQNSEIAKILDNRTKAQQQGRAYLTGVLNPDHLIGFTRYYLKLRQLEFGGREVLQQIVREVEKRRLALVEATKHKKIYEKLRERHLERHIREANLALQKENDEIGQQTFLRNH
jgi:flagellar FliJ protein